MCFLYSSSVVAPTISDLPCKRGFKHIGCIYRSFCCACAHNRMKFVYESIILPSACSISLRTALSLSSNSPGILNRQQALLYQVQRPSCLSASPAHLLQQPSAQALQQWRSFQHRALPIRTGLFFVLLESTCMMRLISSSLPITGSSFPFLASSVRSRL